VARAIGSVAPGLRLLSSYERGWLSKDVMAGLVLTALLVPQGMAYAELAGLPPITGLYTLILCLVAYAVFGPSRILVLGPDSSLGYHDVRSYPDAEQLPGCVLYRFDAPLFFANARTFRDQVRPGEDRALRADPHHRPRPLLPHRGRGRGRLPPAVRGRLGPHRQQAGPMIPVPGSGDAGAMA
jgi:MFS superfamily sulfate permease-like transporter